MPTSDPGPSVMREKDAEEYVLRLLRDRGPLTTREVELAASTDRRRCPDQTVLFLSKMRSRGLIVGEPSLEKRGWVWSLQEDG